MASANRRLPGSVEVVPRFASAVPVRPMVHQELVLQLVLEVLAVSASDLVGSGCRWLFSYAGFCAKAIICGARAPT